MRLHSRIASGSGGTMSIGATAAFSVIQVDAGTNPVATGPHDTLTLTGNSGPIVTTGNAGTDTVTYSLDYTKFPVAGASLTGLLTFGDWGIFNSKQPAGSYITALTGDGTATGPGSVPFTLATVNASPGSFGTMASALLATVNAKGLVTALGATAILIAESQVTNLVSDLAGKQPLLTIGNLTAATTGVSFTNGTGAVIGTGTALSIAIAGASLTGLLSFTDWGTFNSKQAALTIGNLTTPTTGVSITNGVGAVIGTGSAVSIATAGASTTGLLSFTDWGTFNGKQPAGNYITALTGDGTASGPGSAALILATVNSSPGTFGTLASALIATVNAKGLVTALGATAILITESQVTNLVSDLAAKQTTTLTSGNILVGNVSNVAASVTMSGDATLVAGGALTIANGAITNAKVSASAAIAFSKLAALASGNILVGSAGTVATSVAMSGDATLVASGAVTLATVNSNVGSFAGANITVNAKGLITAASSGTEPLSIHVNGDNSPSATIDWGNQNLVDIKYLATGTATPTSGFSVTATPAAPASVATATGSTGDGGVFSRGAIGGGTTIATNGTGGVGGAQTITAGTGGVAASAVSASTGGGGGATTLTGGTGGAAAVSGVGVNIGGAGGQGRIAGGAGGAASLGGLNTGGAGGNGALVGGAGAAADFQGGAGGNALVLGGGGGAGTGVGGTGGAGGGVAVAGGAGSSTGSGSAGGSITFTAGSAGGDNTVSRAGGGFGITAGNSVGSATGGAINCAGGTGGVGTGAAGAAGGQLTFSGGVGGANSTAGGAGGAVVFTGGVGGTSAGTPGAGGIIAFLTATTTSLVNRFTITAAGLLGVGSNLSPTYLLDVLGGDVAVATAGNGYRTKEGSNAKQGTTVLVAGTKVVANTSVTANSRIFLTAQSLGTIAVPAALAVTARVAGTSFTITSSALTDTSTVAYEIFEPY